jgi:hypothetical protein
VATRKSHCGDPSLFVTRRVVTAPAPTRNRVSNTGRPFTHTAALSDAVDGTAGGEEDEVLEDAELDDEADDDDDDAP